MFTGLIEEVGTVTGIDSVAGGSRLTIEAGALAAGLLPGDSIAVDGVCLTAVRVADGRFAAEVSPETIARSNLAFYQIGTRVNLERPLAASARVGGHFVQGHVDGTTRQTSRLEEGDFVRMGFAIPEGADRLLVDKGSVAVNGVSLTVARLFDGEFEVQLVPHTLKHTNLDSAARAESMNLELDILGKYVARLLGERLAGEESDATGGAVELLGRRGFIEPAGGGR